MSEDILCDYCHGSDEVYVKEDDRDNDRYIISRCGKCVGGFMKPAFEAKINKEFTRRVTKKIALKKAVEGMKKCEMKNKT